MIYLNFKKLFETRKQIQLISTKKSRNSKLIRLTLNIPRPKFIVNILSVFRLHIIIFL